MVSEAVPTAFEFLQQTIMLKRLLHRNGRFDRLKINILVLWHKESPFNVQ